MELVLQGKWTILYVMMMFFYQTDLSDMYTYWQCQYIKEFYRELVEHYLTFPSHTCNECFIWMACIPAIWTSPGALNSQRKGFFCWQSSIAHWWSSDPIPVPHRLPLASSGFKTTAKFLNHSKDASKYFTDENSVLHLKFYKTLDSR